MATTAEKAHLDQGTQSSLTANCNSDDRQLFRGDISVRLRFLCYFQSLFYLKQATQPVFSLVVFCLPSSCVVRARIFFIWTNLMRENEKCFKTSLHNLHNVYNNVWNFHWDWFTTATSILWTCKESTLQHSLFWRYAKFSKIIRTIQVLYTSMTRQYILVWIDRIFWM